jgi:hypothetical protein
MRWLMHVLWMCLLACSVAACHPYDASLLKNTSSSIKNDSGPTPMQDGGDACVATSELCNQIDDDCDGKADEDTVKVCESVIVNAETDCIALGKTASCVLLSCKPGYDNCDGNPANGCEPYCACHSCPDAGPAPAEDAGRENDAGDITDDAGPGADAG